MALTNCKECDKEVSTEAKTCPYCGIDNPGVIDNNNRRVCKTAWKIRQFFQKKASIFTSSIFYLIVFMMPTVIIDWKS